jgi:hypothetical protein
MVTPGIRDNIKPVQSNPPKVNKAGIIIGRSRIGKHPKTLCGSVWHPINSVII